MSIRCVFLAFSESFVSPSVIIKYLMFLVLRLIVGRMASIEIAFVNEIPRIRYRYREVSLSMK